MDVVVQNAIEGRPPGHVKRMILIEKKIIEQYIQTRQWNTVQ